MALSAPKTEDIFYEEYLQKRGWEGHVMWIDSLAGMNFEACEDNPVAALQQTLENWKEHYKTQYVEEAISFWCREHCEGRWDKFFIYGVEFESKEDAVLFKLSWCLG